MRGKGERRGEMWLKGRAINAGIIIIITIVIIIIIETTTGENQ